jgi:hypothetical protein
MRDAARRVEGGEPVMRRFAVMLAIALCPAVVRAQAPEAPEAPDASPHGHGAHDDLSRAMQPPEVAESEPSSDVPVGAIRVLVVDAAGQPVQGAEIQLGVMQQGGDRNRTPGETGADGVFTYTGLGTGVGQAYRVNVPFDGATYSSTPFQLPPDRGYDVRVHRLPTTHDDHVLLQVMAQTLVEIRESRLHVIQQTQIANVGEETFVFPEDGIDMALPEGWLAFQAQPVMTDQHIEEQPGEGLRLRGSLPPGSVTLAWAYDLPITGSEMTFSVANPLRTYIYRVISDAPPELRLEVEGMPRAIRFEDQGRSLLGTEVQRAPGSGPLADVVITLRGIPGPGPMRWIASGIALLFVLGGLFAVVRGGPAVSVDHAQRRKELLAELAAVEAEFASGEIGPSYRQSQRDALVRALATALYEEERAKSPRSSA